MDKLYLQKRFRFFIKEMGLEDCNIKLEFVEHDWKNTGNVKLEIKQQKEWKSIDILLDICYT